MVGGSQALTISYEARCVAFCGGLWFFGAPTVMIRIHYSIPCCIRRPLQSGFSHSHFFFVVCGLSWRRAPKTVSRSRRIAMSTVRITPAWANVWRPSSLSTRIPLAISHIITVHNHNTSPSSACVCFASFFLSELLVSVGALMHANSGVPRAEILEAVGGWRVHAQP